MKKLILLFFGPIVGMIPMACLAAVLIMVSYNMSGWRSVLWLAKNPKSDFVVMLVTFILTVVFDLTVAIEVGLLLAVLLFIRRTNEATVIRSFSNELDPNANSDVYGHDLEKLKSPRYTEVYEIDGPYFFGIANKFDDISRHTVNMGEQKVRIIRMRKVSFIDSTGIHNLTTLIEMNHENGTEVILSGITAKVQKQLLKANFHKVLPSKNFCNNIDEALHRAEEILK